jgi:DNA/RNA-binding domain of Phe-tRNA-synthetase-like protein
MLSVTLTLPVHAAVIECAQLTVTGDQSGFRRLRAVADGYAARHAKDGPSPPGVVQEVRAARSLFRALGVDPTKTRPSSEALLRRALKGKPLYSINTLVDVGNWCSLEFLLPLGLYDRHKIHGSVVLRPGRPDEGYQGIAEKTVHVEGRYVLVDDLGPFGSPVTDSLRTSVTLDTTNAVMIIFAPPEYDPERLSQQAQTAARRMTEVCGGRTLDVRLLDGGTGSTVDIQR